MTQKQELVKVLREHACRYPQIEPTDAVKLIYQNEFGPGHFVENPAKSLAYLKAEHQTIMYNTNAPAFEEIGNGLVRVHLCAVKESQLEALNNAFVQTANTHKGTLTSFLEKLEILKNLTEQGAFTFQTEALESYLQKYKDAGYPPVSHSQTYKEHYCPAYRVVRKDLIN